MAMCWTWRISGTRPVLQGLVLEGTSKDQRKELHLGKTPNLHYECTFPAIDGVRFVIEIAKLRPNLRNVWMHRHLMQIFVNAHFLGRIGSVCMCVACIFVTLSIFCIIFLQGYIVLFTKSIFINYQGFCFLALPQSNCQTVAAYKIAQLSNSFLPSCGVKLVY